MTNDISMAIRTKYHGIRSEAGSNNLGDGSKFQAADSRQRQSDINKVLALRFKPNITALANLKPLQSVTMTPNAILSSLVEQAVEQRDV